MRLKALRWYVACVHPLRHCRRVRTGRSTSIDTHKLLEGQGGRAPAPDRTVRRAGCRASLRPTPRTRGSSVVSGSRQGSLVVARGRGESRVLGTIRDIAALSARISPPAPGTAHPHGVGRLLPVKRHASLLASASPTPPLHAHPGSSQRVEHVLELDKFVGGCAHHSASSTCSSLISSSASAVA